MDKPLTVGELKEIAKDLPDNTKVIVSWECCGSCKWLVVAEGEPYYCALRDLYTIRDEQDNACEEYVERGKRND